jgi:Putative prokaryotic signal transducing protein
MKLVKVAWAQQLPEAELLQSFLRDEGIPCMARRAAGFDVPDFLAAGPREILVAEGNEEWARRVLDGWRPTDDDGPTGGEARAGSEARAGGEARVKPGPADQLRA